MLRNILFVSSMHGFGTGRNKQIPADVRYGTNLQFCTVVITMDRRQQKTREAIFAALSQLLQTKRYEQITVQNILDTANIGRSTFYAHFETKDELLHSLCSQIFEHIFSDELMGEATHDFSHGHTGLSEQLTHLLYHLRDQQKIVGNVLSGESREIFLHYFTAYLSALFSQHVAPIPGVPQEYTLHHYIFSFAETVIWWFQSGMCYSPEEMVRFYRATAAI